MERQERFQFIDELFVGVLQAVVNRFAKGFEIAEKLLYRHLFFKNFLICVNGFTICMKLQSAEYFSLYSDLCTRTNYCPRIQCVMRTTVMPFSLVTWPTVFAWSLTKG